jgi:GT2 family glycosyltransferase
MGAVQDRPSVSIVIPNWNGAEHLPDCLDSIEQLDYPPGLVDVLVVDNGSSDGSVGLVESDYSWVHVVTNDRNEGFAAACNTGAQTARSDCVVFLNNDMRVDAGWLAGLADAYDAHSGYVCVGGVILDWEGVKLDFAGGWANFHGFAGQMHSGKPLDERLIEDRRDLLFACGGSMLVDRSVFLALGGFDPSYFAYYEDVDLGWRLWLSGYRVRLAGAARTYHKLHGTESGLPAHRRAFLCERNALCTLMKNCSDESLARLLPASLALLAVRARLRLESEPERGLAVLRAADEFTAELPQLLTRRREVQARRKREDNEVFALFRWPFARIAGDPAYAQSEANVRAAFGIDELFEPNVGRVRKKLREALR